MIDPKKSIQVKVPEPLYDIIATSARQGRRSLGQQVILMIEQALGFEPGTYVTGYLPMQKSDSEQGQEKD